MTVAAIRLLEYLSFLVTVYALVFVFTFIAVLFNEIFKENKRRKGKKS
jgi:hypothetical protein